MDINNCEFWELPVELQDKVNVEIEGDNFLFTCPNCRSQFIREYDLTEYGQKTYKCEDCGEEFTCDDIEVI